MDDCRLVRATIAAMLEHFGAVVTVVGSADEALEAVERERPDVLLSDLAMPDKGGYWLIGQVRALPPERGGATPAAALTGFTGPEHRAAALRAGFEYHIEKPVTLHNLAEIVSILALKAQSPPHSVPQGFHRSTAPNCAGMAEPHVTNDRTVIRRLRPMRRHPGECRPLTNAPRTYDTRPGVGFDQAR